MHFENPPYQCSLKNFLDFLSPPMQHPEHAMDTSSYTIFILYTTVVIAWTIKLYFILILANIYCDRILVYKIPYRRAPRLAYRPLGRVRRATIGYLVFNINTNLKQNESATKNESSRGGQAMTTSFLSRRGWG